MSPGAVTVVTYVWHYLVARVIYDQLVRPLGHGHATEVPLLVCVAVLAFAVGRLTRRRA